jgi:hypothetical protein
LAVWNGTSLAIPWAVGFVTGINVTLITLQWLSDCGVVVQFVKALHEVSG